MQAQGKFAPHALHVCTFFLSHGCSMMFPHSTSTATEAFADSLKPPPVPKCCRFGVHRITTFR